MADKMEQWVVYNPAPDYPEPLLCTITNEEGEYIADNILHETAEEIVALHNSAISISPSNPMAVAEGMEGMYRALKKMVKDGIVYEGGGYGEVFKTLAEIEGK